MDVLPASAQPEMAELVTALGIAASLPILRRDYKWVVIDSSATFSEVNLAVFDQSDLIVLVTTADGVGLKLTRAALDIFASLHLPGERRLVALSQPRPYAHLKVEEVRLP